MSDTVEQFRQALQRHEAECRMVTPDSFPSVIAECVKPPAVGSPIPFDGYELSKGGVNVEPTARDLHNARTGVCAARLGICATGSLLIHSPWGGEDPVSLFPEHQVALLRREDLVPDLGDALRWIGERAREGPTDVIVVTGPSATADMGELVYGAHGPRQLTVLLGESP